MDLRSLLRRLGGSSSGGASASASPGAASAAHVSGPVSAERPSRPAWRDAPPIQRSVAPAPLTARTVDFAHDLSGHQPAPLALEPLGHEVRADAPSGRVSGLATTRPASTQGAEHGPLQASVRPGHLMPHDGPEPAPATRLAGSPLGGGDGGAAIARASSAPASPPARRLEPAQGPAPTVSRSSTSEGASLTRASVARVDPPAGVIGRAQRPGTLAPRPAAADAPAAATTAPRSSTLVLPAATTPVSSGSSALTSTSTSRTALDAARPVGTGRRIRIGAPIDGAGPEFRMIGRQPVADQAGGRAAPAASTDRTVRPAGDAALPRPTPEAPALHATARRATVQRSDDDELEGPDPVATPTSVPVLAASGAPVQVTLRPAAPRPAERPLVGGLRAGAVRAGSAPGPEHPGPPAAAGPRPASPGPTPPSVADIVASLASGGSIAARAGAAPAPGPGDRGPGRIEPGFPAASTESAPTPLATAVQALPGASAETHPSWPARSTTPDPSPWQPPIRRVAARAGRAPASLAVAGAAGTDRRSAAATATVQRVATPTVAGSRPTVQTGAAAAEPSPLEVLLDATADEPASPSSSTSSGDMADTMTAPPPGGPTLRAATAPASGGSSLLAAGATEGAEGGTSDKELDELARKLFPRLQTRLRTELLVDRERIGALVDFSR